MARRWTFKTVPGLFYQLYVIHALKGGQNVFKDGHLLPSLFVLLPNKSEETYARMWNKVRNSIQSGLPRTTNAVEAWHRSFG